MIGAARQQPGGQASVDMEWVPPLHPVWIAVPLVSLGALAFAPFLYAAIRRSSRLLGVWAAFYLVVAAAGVVLAGATSGNSVGNSAAGMLLICAAGGARYTSLQSASPRRDRWIRWRGYVWSANAVAALGPSPSSIRSWRVRQESGDLILLATKMTEGWSTLTMCRQASWPPCPVSIVRSLRESPMNVPTSGGSYPRRTYRSPSTYLLNSCATPKTASCSSLCSPIRVPLPESNHGVARLRRGTPSSAQLARGATAVSSVFRRTSSTSVGNPPSLAI